MSDTQTRKSGDTLILSGKLDRVEGGDVYPADADWVGAVGKINIVDKATPTLIAVDHGTVTLTDPSGATLATYRYQGAAGVVAIGVFIYEVEVSFANGVVLTWPNDGTKYVLKIVPELS